MILVNEIAYPHTPY